MKIVPEQLESTSLLIMYVAEELPARQRAELEKRLSSDASLRAQLREIRELQAGFESQMRHLDAASSASGHAMLVRRVSDAMRQHGALPQNAQEQLTPRRVLRFPAWAYPIAAAAAVALVFVARFAFTPAPPTAHNPVAVLPSADNDAVMFVELRDSFTDHNPTQAPSLESLRSAESELADIATMTRSESVPDLFSDQHSLNGEANQ